MSTPYNFELKQPNMIPVGEVSYRLEEDYTYYWEDDAGTINRMTVPKGTITDGATVPRFVWSMTGIRPDGLIRAGALIHDWIYVNQGNPPVGSHTQWVGSVHEFFEFYYPNRDDNDLDPTYIARWEDAGVAWSHNQADKLLSKMGKEAGMTNFKVTLVFIAVRVFGWWI